MLKKSPHSIWLCLPVQIDNQGGVDWNFTWMSVLDQMVMRSTWFISPQKWVSISL